MLSETRATRSIYHVYTVKLFIVTAQYSEASHEWQEVPIHQGNVTTCHIGVELEFIAHFCAFIRSSIALFKSMPFTWCVLSLPYGPSYCTHPVVFFPIFFPFFSSQKCFALWGNWTSHLLFSFVDFRLCGLCHCTVASPYVTPHCRQSVALSSKSPDFIELDLGV